MMRAATKIPSSVFSPFNQVQLVKGGRQYFDMLLKMISEAAVSIHIQTYIFGDDETGREVLAALKDAVKRKVAVYVMADGYASQSMSKTLVAEIRAAGILFRFFEPVFKSRNFYFGRRLHHKVVVTDALHALVGGVNIADRYNDLPGKPAWLDFAVLVKGDLAQKLCLLCVNTWQGYLKNPPLISCEAAFNHLDIAPENQCEIRMRRNDWVLRKNEISRTYIEMMQNAKTHITFLCSYFLPGTVIRRQILKAVKRGVSIRVIAAGRSDVPLAKYAERWLYDWLLRNGIELYEYQKNVLHGKVAVCDDKWMTIGSYNINNISAYASIELNLDIRNKTFTEQMRQTLEDIIQNDCVRITTEHHVKANNIFKQLMRWFSYQFIRFVFYLFTFYFKQQG